MSIIVEEIDDQERTARPSGTSELPRGFLLRSCPVHRPPLPPLGSSAGRLIGISPSPFTSQNSGELGIPNAIPSRSNVGYGSICCTATRYLPAGMDSIVYVPALESVF